MGNASHFETLRNVSIRSSHEKAMAGDPTLDRTLNTQRVTKQNIIDHRGPSGV